MSDKIPYATIRLLNDLSNVLWFIEKYAEEDSRICGHVQCKQLVDLVEQHIHEILCEIKTHALMHRCDRGNAKKREDEHVL